MSTNNTEKKFIPRDGQVDFTNIRWAPVINCLVKYNNEILLVKRNANMNLYPGYWNGISGFLDDNKSLEEKVIEEMSEELGYSKDNLLAIKLCGVLDQDEPKYKKTWIIHAVSVTVNSKEIKLDWEAEKFSWVKAEEISNYELLPGFEKIIELCL